MHLDDFLLKIESNPKILDFKIDDIPLWLIIRPRFLWDLEKEKLKLEEPHIRISPLSLSLKDKVGYIYTTLCKNPFFALKKDILIISSVVDDIKEREMYVNRLYYKIVKTYPSLLLESSFKFKYRQPKKDYTLYMDFIDWFAVLFKSLKKITHSEQEIIDKFCSFLNLDNKYYHILLSKIKIAKIRKIFFDFLLKKIRPKLVILQGAHYGNRIELLLLCKRKKIKIVEYQHGYIGPTERTYNFHPNLLNKLLPYLPDFLLTWGKYWSESVNTPVQKIEIGHFYLWDKTKNRRIPSQNNNNNRIVLISGGTLPNEYNLIGQKLKKELFDHELIFRPHPSERVVASKRYKELFQAGFEIDNSNLYCELLPSCSAVISLEVSTVLYEALAFTDKIYLYDIRNRFNRENKPFIISNKDSIVADILCKKRIENINIDYFFKPYPMQNFKNFLKLCLLRSKT